MPAYPEFQSTQRFGLNLFAKAALYRPDPEIPLDLLGVWYSCIRGTRHLYGGDREQMMDSPSLVCLDRLWQICGSPMARERQQAWELCNAYLLPI
jgi:hypothetical protein